MPRNHPLSIEAIFPTPIIEITPTPEVKGNHPLSIEAIFPTWNITLRMPQR